MTNRPSRHRVYGFLAWALCAGLYLWTAEGVSIKYGDRENAWHHYEYLVDGFLSGHLYLSRAPAPALLALPDPYDPQANLRYRLWDASLYHGKYYLYYGPTPAVLLMLPWKVVTGHHLPQWAAAAVFAIAGFGALALLLARIREKYFPTATPAQLFLAIVLAGHVSWLPVILRRPAFWELPIVTAAALFWWSLFFLWKYHETGQRPRWAVAGGCALAFALGARPTYLPCAGFIALLFTPPFAREIPWSRYFRRLLPVVVPLLLGGGALLAYNYQRFGDIFEFGNRYQLWGMDERSVSHFSPGYFGFNTWVYFFSLPEISPYFPFFRTVWPDSFPPGYIAIEEMPGLLFAMPALLLGFFAWRHVLRSNRAEPAGSLRLLLVAATGASALTGGLLFCFAGGCSRYIVEVLAGWSLVVGLGWLALLSRAPRSRSERIVRLLAGAAGAWTILCVWLASFDFRGFAQITHPRFYQAIAEPLDYPSYWAANRDGQVFGPVALDLQISNASAENSAIVLSAGRLGMQDLLVLERVAPGRVRLRLAANAVVLVETPVLEISGSTLHVECFAPWLYPPKANPFWRTFSDPAERRERQTLFALRVNGVVTAQHSEWSFDPTRFEPFARTAGNGTASVAWVAKLTRLGPTRLPTTP